LLRLRIARVREIIARWVKHYNEKRLHAGLDYLRPAEYYRGDPEARHSERKAKLASAREERKRINRERLKERAKERLNTPQRAA
jgi:hypothetical protein